MRDDAEIFLSVAEAAKRLGVTARALRLYERKGLVAPRRTAAGWRVYGSQELSRLHLIVALRSMGFALARIKALLDGGVALDDVLLMQEEALQADAARIARALILVRRARERRREGHALDADELIDLTKEAAMVDRRPTPEMEQLMVKHLTPEQLGRLVMRRMANKEVEEERTARWHALIARAEALAEAGSDPGAPEGLALAREMRVEYAQMSHADPDIVTAMDRLYEEAFSGPNAGQGMPFSKAAWEFMGAARACLAAEEDGIV